HTRPHLGETWGPVVVGEICSRVLTRQPIERGEAEAEPAVSRVIFPCVYCRGQEDRYSDRERIADARAQRRAPNEEDGTEERGEQHASVFLERRQGGEHTGEDEEALPPELRPPKEKEHRQGRK